MKNLHGWLVLTTSVVAIGLAGLFVVTRVNAVNSCVVFVDSQFDAPGNDNINLNEEWVRIQNNCGQAKSIGGWKIHDRGRNPVYIFPSSFVIGDGATVTLHSGKGTNTATDVYWRLSWSVWNNAGDVASLRNSRGTLKDQWVEGAPPTATPTLPGETATPTLPGETATPTLPVTEPTATPTLPSETPTPTLPPSEPE